VPSKKIELSVNYIPINIESFVQQFIEAVITGILSALKDYKEANDIKLSIDGDTVDIITDNNKVQINPFVNTVIRNTVIGMISSLKNVGQTDKLEIHIS
jgi:hypothetical protein